jgi:hypothetical protein
MEKTLLAFCIALTGLLLACATSYQPEGFSGGYSEEHLKGNEWAVSFQGNAFTSDAQAMKYAYQRAGEICAEHGYSDFETVGGTDEGKYGGTVQVGGGFQTQKWPKITIFIRCTH